jgi:hypothetical protein
LNWGSRNIIKMDRKLGLLAAKRVYDCCGQVLKELDTIAEILQENQKKDTHQKEQEQAQSKEGSSVVRPSSELKFGGYYATNYLNDLSQRSSL